MFTKEFLKLICSDLIDFCATTEAKNVYNATTFRIWLDSNVYDLKSSVLVLLQRIRFS